jgi:hypothetical protein
MATNFKVLGQIQSVANTLQDVYVVPNNANTIVSTINVCNQASTSDIFRVAIRPGNATIQSKHYIAFNTTVPPNDTVSLSLGLGLGQTDVITVMANTSSVSFGIFGTEIS